MPRNQRASRWNLRLRMESLSIDAKYWNFTHIEQTVWFARTFFISFARRGKRRTLYPACHPPVMMLCSTPGSFALWCVEMCSTGNSCQVDFSLIRFDPQLMYKYMTFQQIRNIQTFLLVKWSSTLDQLFVAAPNQFSKLCFDILDTFWSS